MIDNNNNFKTIIDKTSKDANSVIDNNYSDKESEGDINNNSDELEQIVSNNESNNISKKKLDQIVSLDTIVYEIQGFGESRIKDYGKLSIEIKKVEQMNKIEKAKLKKKIMQMNKRLNDNKDISVNEANKKENSQGDNNGGNVQNKLLNLQVKKLMMMEYERDKKLNFLEVIQKLKIPPEKRTVRDVLRIKTYINQSKLGLNFKDEFTDINIVEKLIHFCCIEMCYKKFKKDETIIKIGDTPDYFYSIIFGKVNILKPIPKKEYLTGFQYFKYLMNMRKRKENYIFNECIKNNKKFYIEPIHGEIIHFIYLLIYLEHIRTNSEPTIDLDKILDLLNIKPEELGIDPNLVTSNYYINDNLKKIIKKIPPIASDIIEQYSFISDYLTKKEVIIYEYNKFFTLQTNDYFGDSGIEANSPRNYTIIAEEDTEIAYLSNKLYFAQIASEKAIILQNKILNLHRSNFFHKIKFYKFSKKYYSWFISEKYAKGDILFNEGENIKFFYFIEEGSVELSLNKSMYEINSLINLIEEKKQILVRSSYHDIIFSNLNKNEGEYINPQNNIYNYSQISSTFDDIINYLNQKQSNKLIILNSKEDIGIASYFLGSNYLCSCEVVSKYAKIYKIDIDYLNQMLESEYEIKWEFFRRLKNKMELLSKRLFRINNIKLIMTDEKISQNKLNQKSIEQNETIPINNNTNNKALINYDKINSLFNQQKDINSINVNNDSNIINNSINDKIRPKNELVELPILNTNKIKNSYSFSLTSLHNGNHDQSITQKSLKAMNKQSKVNNLKLLSIVNQKFKNISPKRNIIEDNFLSKIQKELISFSQNRYTLSRDKINFNISRNSIKKKKGLFDSSNKKEDKIYLTDLTYNNLKFKNSPNNKEIEKNSNNFNTINEINASLTIKTFDKMPQSPQNTINLENSGDLKYLRYSNNYRSLSNDYYRFNTENNNTISNKNNESVKGKIFLHKKYNHPYYDPLTLIKKEKYKIFENKDNKYQSDYLHTHLERVNELKKIRSALKNNFKIKIKMFKKNK